MTLLCSFSYEQVINVGNVNTIFIHMFTSDLF